MEAFVFDTFVALLETASIPFIQTVNTRVAGALPAEWTTLEFENTRTERITIGQTNILYRETGTFNVVIHVRSGIGLSRANILASEIGVLFRDYAVGYLRVVSVQSGTIFQPDEGNFFQVRVPVDYQFDFNI